MPSPILVAHRGGSLEVPENTMAAFKYALSRGFRCAETDVHMSKDGVLVVMHDEMVDRTSDGTGEIRDMTLDELRTLDIGSWFSPQYAGERIPTLREVLELYVDAGAGLVIELKSPHLYPGILEKLAALIGEMWVRGGSNIWCISFDHGAIDRLHAIDGGLPLGKLWMPEVNEFAVPDINIEATCPYFGTVAQHPEQVTRAHDLGQQVFVWTVNDEADMRRMAELGVDGIVSDRPSLLAKHFGRTV